MSASELAAVAVRFVFAAEAGLELEGVGLAMVVENAGVVGELRALAVFFVEERLLYVRTAREGPFELIACTTLEERRDAVQARRRGDGGHS